MDQLHSYELIKAGKVVGKVTYLHELHGLEVVIPYNVKLKTKVKRKELVVPLRVRFVERFGAEVTFRWYLDVSRKSKKQIKIIKESGYEA